MAAEQNRELAAAFIRKNVDEKVNLSDFSDDEIRAYYDGHKSEFQRDPEVRAYQIVVEKAAEANALIADLRPKRDLEAFKEKARAVSIDKATATLGGDLGYFTAKSGPSERIRNAAFSIRTVGDVFATPIEVPNGFAVIAFGGASPLNRDFEQAKQSIRYALLREKKRALQDKLIADLRDEYHVEINGRRTSKSHHSRPPPGIQGVQTITPETQQ
ncbi:MAG: peptidyl-prolyl cis-trans isomerase [Polyangiales bacterium]